MFSPRSGVAHAAGFVAFIAAMMLEPAAAAALSRMMPRIDWQPSWLYPLRVVAGALALAWGWRGLSELKARPLPGAARWMEAAAVGVVVFVVWLALGAHVHADRAEMPPPWPPHAGWSGAWLALRVVGSALLVPVIEELFWRSYLMRRIDAPRFADLPAQRTSAAAVIVSSIAFALEHREWLAGAAAGLTYAWLYRRHGDIRLAMAAHAVTNAALAVFVLSLSAYSWW